MWLWLNYPRTVFLTSSGKLLGLYYLAKLFLHLTGFSQSKFSVWRPQIRTYTKLSTLTQIEFRLSRGQCQYWSQNTGVIRVPCTLVLLGLAVLLRVIGQIIEVSEAYSKLRVMFSLFINWLWILIRLVYAHRQEIHNAKSTN